MMKTKHRKPHQAQGANAGLNNLVGNLGNELNQMAAKMFGRLVMAQDQTLNFLDADSRKHLGLCEEKFKAARATLLRAGLITYQTYCGGTGGSYSITAKGTATIAKYWPSYRVSDRKQGSLSKPATSSVTKIVVVPPVKTSTVEAIAA